MNNKNYNQYEEYYLRNACSIVTLLNILKYNFAIFVKPTFIIKIAIYLERLKFFNPAKWAEFWPIYKIFVWELNRRLWLNFWVIVNQISKLTKEDKRTYWVWVKWYWTAKWKKAKRGWFISKKDLDYLNTFSWGVGHNLAFDNDGWWTIVDTDWGRNTKMTLTTLKYGLKLNLFWDNIRTIDPLDNYTKTVVRYTIRLFLAEKRGTLDRYLEKNKRNKYIMKAKELYLYGR